MAITAAQVQELYVAYLGRAADKAGLEYWLGELNDPASGLTLENLRANFVNEQPEYTAAYGGLGVAQTVARIYDNLFERAFDQAGLNYWVGEVNAGRVPVDQLLVAFLNAASATDRQVVSNKVLVAEAYTAAFAGNFNKAGAAAAIGAVDGSPASVNAALNKITADSNGLTLLLSAGADLGAAYVGGPGNDTFLANDNSHLQVVDVLDGGAGSDRLVFAGRQGVADNVFANVSSIESVEFLQAVAEGDIYRLGANAAAAGVTDVFLRNEAHVLSLQGFDRDLAVTGSSLADRVAVDLADAGDKTLNLGGGFDNIVILAEPGAAAGATVVSFVSADVGSNSAAAVRIDGSQGDVFTENTRVIIRGTQTDQFSVIGSDAAGNLLSNQDRGDFKTLLLGTSGNDQLTVVAASEPGSVYVNAGAGADILNATALADQRHFLVGGVGSDTFNVQTTAASGRVVIISGPGDDVINVGVGEAPAHSGSVDVTLVSGTNTVTFAEGLTLNTADIAANDRLTGGTGRDTLAATAAQLLAVATPGSSEQQSVSGFEVLTVTDAQLGLASGDGLVAARIQAGIDTINLEGSSVGSAGITFDGTTDATLNLKAAMATGASLNVTMAGSDSDDRLTITNAAAGNVFNGATLNASGVETLILEGSGSDAAGLQTLGDIALTLTPLAASTVNFVGAQGFAVGTVTASNIDASGLTGSAGLRMTSAATTTTVTGSANADVVTLGAGMASIALGDGDDVLSAGRPLDGDTLNGGDGRDTLILGAAVQSAAVANVSGFEVLSLAAAVSQDLQQFGADQAFDVVRIDNGGANEISGASASLLALGLTVSAIESVSFSRLADTPADALTLLTLGAGSSDRVTEVGTLTVNGEERLVIDTGAAVVSSEQTYTSSLAINTLNAAAATTISVAGAGDVSLRMADQGEADALRSFDASAALGAVTFDASLLSADLTITGGRGVDTYTLGQGVHTIIEAGSAASVAENRVVDIDVINGFVVGRDTLGMSGTLYQSRGIYMDGAFTAQAEGDSVLIFASGDDATLQSGEFALVLVGVGGTGLLDLDGPAA